MVYLTFSRPTKRSKKALLHQVTKSYLNLYYGSELFMRIQVRQRRDTGMAKTSIKHPSRTVKNEVNNRIEPLSKRIQDEPCFRYLWILYEDYGTSYYPRRLVNITKYHWLPKHFVSAPLPQIMGFRELNKEIYS